MYDPIIWPLCVLVCLGVRQFQKVLMLSLPFLVHFINVFFPGCIGDGVWAYAVDTESVPWLEEITLDPEDPWSGILSKLTWAIRSTTHSSLNATPGKIAFGRDMLYELAFTVNWNDLKEKSFDVINTYNMILGRACLEDMSLDILFSQNEIRRDEHSVPLRPCKLTADEQETHVR